jgi:hypothetical protein
MSQNGSAGQDGPPRFGPPSDLDGLLPGDRLDLGEQTGLTVKTILHGSETIDALTVEWRWIFLDDGTLLELAPKGRYVYREHQLFPRGSAVYEELVAQDGALVRFERQVREGHAGRRPVHVTLQGRRYRVTSTGTCLTRRLGVEPDLAPYRAFQPEPDQNVYFNLVAVGDGSQVGLGLWTTDLALSFGRPLRLEDLHRVRRED